MKDKAKQIAKQSMYILIAIALALLLMHIVPIFIIFLLGYAIYLILFDKNAQSFLNIRNEKQ